MPVGDLLFAQAFAELASEPGPGRRIELLANASVGLALGELAQRADAFDTGIDAERYFMRCRLKTARLFECACTIGRDDPGADAALKAYGAGIGLAFQLLDDVLDVSGPPERTGKARGTDLLDGTVTLPFIAARERDPSLAQLDLRSLDPAAAEQVCDAIATTGALDDVRARAGDEVGRAKGALTGSGLDDDVVRLLELVADGVVERYS